MLEGTIKESYSKNLTLLFPIITIYSNLYINTDIIYDFTRIKDKKVMLDDHNFPLKIYSIFYIHNTQRKHYECVFFHTNYKFIKFDLEDKEFGHIDKTSLCKYCNGKKGEIVCTCK